MLSTLAGSVGSPAFSVARSRFILIEGTRERRERERFASLLEVGSADRFVEADSCSEVIERVRALRLLASEEEQLRVGGVVDWDFRSGETKEALLREDAIHVLGVQEIENFFLEPGLLEHLFREHGKSVDVHALLQQASDPHAGRWAFERAKVTASWTRGLGTAHRHAKKLGWTDLDSEGDAAAGARAVAAGFDDVADVERARMRIAFESSLKEYGEMRRDLERLWKECFGKEVLELIARQVGYSGTASHEARAAVLWRKGEVARSEPANALRGYIDSIAVLAR